MNYPSFSVNTDSVDIRNRQIGIHASQTTEREFCAGVNHTGSRDSVVEATRIARLFAAAPDLLAALEHLMRYDFGNSDGAKEARAAIKKARGLP